MGGECVLASEIDKFANQSYEALYGHATAGDITAIDAKDVPDHDLLVGGFPCQAFSVAGKRLGFEDTRGTLFFEVARLAREKQPKAVLLENVKGLVGHDKGRTLDVIVQTLNDIGYTVDFEVLNSKYFGVPQNRERIFIIALRDDLVTQEPWAIEGSTVVPKGKRRIAAYEGVKTFNFEWPAQDEVTTRLRNVLETQVDEKYYLSDDKTAALVAQLEAQVNGLPVKEATTKGYAVAAEGDSVNFQFPDSKTRRGRVGKGIANTLEASSINQGVVERTEPILAGSLGHYGNDQMNRVYSPEGIAPTLTVPSGGGREQKIAELRQFSDGSGISYNLDANYTKGTSPGDVGKGRRTHVIEGERPRYRIRKLTPLECFRLQGFPDEAHQTLVDAGISDSQRYKQAGNAVTVNVIRALGERILPLLG